MPPDDYLLSAQAHADQQTLLLLQRQTREAFSRLTSDQQQRYIQLSRTEPKARQELADTLRAVQQAMNEKVRTTLSIALAEKAGRPVDIDTARFNTTVTEVEPNTLDGVRPGQRTRRESKSLWDAARSNYGFHHSSRWRLGSGDALVAASQIVEPGVRYAMAVRDFIDVVRAVDPGQIVQQHLESAFATSVKTSLTTHRLQSLRLALLDALRSGEISPDEYAQLDTDLLRDDRNWSSYCASTPDSQLYVPLFVRRCTERADFATFSYFPGRPGGAFRRHRSVEEALASFANQLRAGITQGRGHWLTRTLSLRDQIRLQQLLKVPAINPQALNPFAKILYEAFTDKRPAEQRIKLALNNVEPGCSLYRSWSNHSTLSLYSDLLADFMPTTEIDHRTWQQGLQYIASELLDLLQIPAPGGVTGMNKLMLTASLGTLGYQTLVSLRAFANGQTVEFVQAMADILDLSLNVALQAQGARLSARRTRQLLNDLHNPRKVIDRHGTSYLGWHDSPAAAPDLTPLSDAQVLKALLHPQLPPLDIASAETLLKLSGVTRTTLEAIHAGNATAPWQLSTLIERHCLPLEQYLPPHRENMAQQHLRQRFSLSAAVAAHLLREHPTLASMGSHTQLAPEQVNAVLDLQLQSHYIEGLAALIDPQGRGLNGNSESLFCQLLTLQHGWPDDLGIRVYAGYRQHGVPYRSGQLLRSYGPETASRYVTLVRMDDGYAGHDPHNDDLQLPYPGENSLVSATLRALDDTQRDALGIGIHDSPLLGSRIAHDGALIETSQREQWLATPATYPLSLNRLEYFRLSLAVEDAPVTAQGIYTLDRRTYIRHDGATFRVLEDRDASRPDRAVWRIVHPDDPVANDLDNRYLATRPGRSEPVIRTPDNTWAGVHVGGAGGMHRRQLRAFLHANKLEQAKQELDTFYVPIQNQSRLVQFFTDRMDRSVEYGPRGPTAEQRRERRALMAQAEIALDRLIELYETEIKVVERHRNLLKTGSDYYSVLNPNTAKSYRGLITAYHNRLALSNLVIAHDTQALGIFDSTINLSGYRQRCHLYLNAFERHTQYAERTTRTLKSLTDTLPHCDDEAIPDMQRFVELTQADGITSCFHVNEIIFLYHSYLLHVGDPEDIQAPIAQRLHVEEITHRVQQAIPTLHDLKALPADEALPLLEAMQQEFESLGAGLRNLRDEITEARDARHLDAVIILADYYANYATLQLHERTAEMTSASVSRTPNASIDFDFIPQQATPARPEKKRRKIIVVDTRRGRLPVSAEISENDSNVVTVSTHNDTFVTTYVRHDDGRWQQRTAPRQSLLPSAWEEIIATAAKQLAHEQTWIDKAQRMIRENYLPIDAFEYLQRQSEQLERTAETLKGHEAGHPLYTQLRASAERLEKQGLQIRIDAYKNKDVLNTSHLRFLMAHAQIGVVQKLERAGRGRGTNRHYLDVYEIRDSETGLPLWEAHFHYPSVDTPAERFEFKAGHLKLLAQARQGSSHQAAAERAGKAITPIWREALDKDTAQRLFALAGGGASH